MPEYNCKEHGHVWDKWFPLDRTHVRRQCKVCNHIEEKQVLS